MRCGSPADERRGHWDLGAGGSEGDHHDAPADAAAVGRITPGAIFERFIREHPWAAEPAGPASVRQKLTREQFELLTEKMYERLAADGRTRTVETINAIGIVLQGDSAYKAWLGQSMPETVDHPQAAQQAVTIGRLRSLYASQASPGLRGAITRKPN